jgi:ankyrin repeat protein
MTTIQKTINEHIQYTFKCDKTTFDLTDNENIDKCIEIAKIIERFNDTKYVLDFIKNNLINDLLTMKVHGYIINHEFDFDILAFACFLEKYEIIEALLKTELYDINHTYLLGTHSWKTPVMMVSNIKTIKLLIDNGADVNIKDQFGHSAFSEACNNGNIECCKLMYKTGKCDFDEKIWINNKDKMTCGNMLLNKIFKE